jgi:alcohol dehydrogenase class IV
LDGLKHLIPALPDTCGSGALDVHRRGAVAYGAFLSGVTLAHAGLGVVHGVAGPMGGIIPIPHGVSCANLLPAAVAATIHNLKGSASEPASVAINKFSRVGQLFGSGYENPMGSCLYLVDCLYRWLEKLALPRLQVFGLTMDHIEKLVLSGSNKNNPSPLSEDQIRLLIMDRF